MAHITISLSEEQMKQLRQLADRLGVPTEDLVRVGVEDMLTGLDDDVVAHVERILAKNQELYDRLAG